MTLTFNRPNYSFLVQVSTPLGKHVEWQRVDQYLAPRSGERGLDRLTSQVNEHLHQLHLQTRLFYHVIASGRPEEVDRIMPSPEYDDIPF
jgi:hypothetical protein